MAKMKTSGVVLAVVAIAAAAGQANAQHRGSNHNPSLYSVNQPVVQRTDYVFDVASDHRGVPEAELQRLADWFDTLQLGYGDRVSVDTGGYGSRSVRDDVAKVAAEYGLLLSRGAPVTAGTVQPGSARVVVTRSEASVPGCPNWEDAADIGSRITTSTNFGCATNSNLAAMIADPNDLVLGQVGAASGDARTSAKAIKIYRDTAPSGAGGLKETSSKGGK